jgi:hypothetical protein
MTAATVLELPSSPTATVVDLTPETAQRWLGANTSNRNIRPAVVNTYARDMAAGNWQFTGEAIKFDCAGTLLDGQHRLLACIKSGATIRVLVVNGLPADSQNVMDSGAKRQASDALKLAGYPSVTTLAAVARLALALSKSPGAPVSRSGWKGAFSHTEIKDFIEDHPDITEAVKASLHYKDRIDAHSSVTAYVWWRCSKVSHKATVEFFESIANAQTNGKGDPRLALIRRLQSARRANERLSQYAQVSLFFRSWNAWRKGSTVGTFQTVNHRGESLPIPVPR